MSTILCRCGISVILNCRHCAKNNIMSCKWGGSCRLCNICRPSTSHKPVVLEPYVDIDNLPKVDIHSMSYKIRNINSPRVIMICSKCNIHGVEIWCPSCPYNVISCERSGDCRFCEKCNKNKVGHLSDP
jgi:hypothetical protein